jgi:hypothetical protein
LTENPVPGVEVETSVEEDLVQEPHMTTSEQALERDYPLSYYSTLPDRTLYLE